MPSCQNCAVELNGPFCANCGQKADTRRVGWSWILQEVQHSLLHVDRGLLRTLKELFTRPGIAIREYLEGKRAGRFAPFATVIVLATVYSLLYRLMPPDMSGLKGDGKLLVVLEYWNSWMGQYYALMELTLIPLFAFSSWLVMRKYGHNYVEHMVIQSYLAGQRIAISTIFLPLNLISFPVAMLGSMALSTLYLAGMVLSFAQIYEQRSPVAVVFRTLFSFALFFFFLMLFALVGVIVVAQQGSAPGVMGQ